MCFTIYTNLNLMYIRKAIVIKNQLKKRLDNYVDGTIIQIWSSQDIIRVIYHLVIRWYVTKFRMIFVIIIGLFGKPFVDEMGFLEF